MKTMGRFGSVKWLALALAGLFVWGCETAPSGVEEAEVAPPAAEKQYGPPSALAGVLEMAIQDEYQAEYTYQRVLNDLGDATLPFANTVWAERTHVAAIAGLYEDRKWVVPLSDWTLDNVPQFDTRCAACEGGVDGEVENFKMYDSFLADRLPPDVVSVFTSLRDASFSQHRPAFQQCFDVCEALKTVLEEAIDDEYKLLTFYGLVLGQLGDVEPFLTIEAVEQDPHIAGLKELFADVGMTPPDGWSGDPEDLPGFQDRATACAAAEILEQANVDMYQDILEDLDPELLPGLVEHFGNLMEASANHVIAFGNCGS